MTSFSDITGSLRQFYEARHEPESMKPLAEWYWRSLLMVSTMALVLILAYGAWVFVEVLQRLSEGDSQRRASTRDILSKKDLADTLAAFRARQEEFDTLKRAATSVPDPSR